MEEKYFELIKNAKELKEFCDIFDRCDDCIFCNRNPIGIFDDKCLIGIPADWVYLDKIEKEIFDDGK